MFEPYELEFNTLVEPELASVTNFTKNKVINKIAIFYGDTEYIVHSRWGRRTLEMCSTNSLISFRILVDDNKIHNSNTIITETETISDYSCIYLKDTPCFDYQKIIYNIYGEEIIFPAYRAKSISVQKGKSHLFEIIKLEDLVDSREEGANATYERLKQNIKKYVDNLKRKSEIIAIPFSNPSLTIYDNLDSIFSFLEEKSIELPIERKRVKN